MTEDEAKTKWCPFARVAGMDGTSGNRHILSADGMNGADRCIASACMAWREHSPTLCEDCERVAYPIGGYCGLAGRSNP